MKYTEDWEAVKNRYVAWWNGEIVDRVPISILIRDEEKITEKRKQLICQKSLSLEDTWTNTDFLVEMARVNLENSTFIGDTPPYFFTNLGPDIFSGFLGTKMSFHERTSWAEPFINDLSSREVFRFDSRNQWWKKVEEITKAAVKNSKGDYLVGITDIHSGIDALSAMRGPENLCLDMLEQPEEVKKAALELYSVWEEVYDRSFELTNQNAQGTITWMNIWHPKKWYPVSCDFICMISPKMFEEFVLPELSMEIGHLDNSIFHLDGSGALKHLDRLLTIPGLDGIQWGPGAGKPAASHWTEVIRKIQGAGKLLRLKVPSEEVEEFMNETPLEGLFIGTSVKTAEEGKALLDRVNKLSFKKRLF